MIRESIVRPSPRCLARGLACLIIAGVAGLAAPASGQGVGDAQFTETTIERGGRSYTLVSYRKGRGRRRIEASDLLGLTVGNAQLDELPVCIEGKFDRPLNTKVFRLMGSDRQFAVADAARIAGLMSGENLWVGGVARLMRGGAACYVAVDEIVILKGDVDLFKERLSRYTRAKDGQRLLALGRWIETNGKLVKSTIVVDNDLYASLRNRAFRQALRVLEKELAADDVEARFELARMYRELLGRTGDLKAAGHLRRIVKLDPGHEKAIEALSSLGYVIYKDRWMTWAEREELKKEALAERAAELAAARHGETVVMVTPYGIAPKGLATTGRIRRLLEVERKARSGDDALLALAAGLRDEDEPVARRLVWILANTGGETGPEALLGGLQSRSIAVRKDVADALAWCGCVMDLAGMIPGEKEAVVRSHAVSALGSVRTNESVAALIDLLAIDDIGTRARVGEELALTTGQAISDPDVWRLWWEENRDGFEVPKATP